MGSANAASLAGSFSTGAAARNNSGEEDGLREGREKSSADFFGRVFLGTGTLLYAIFDGDEFLVAGEDCVTIQGVVGIVRVENIFVQG